MRQVEDLLWSQRRDLAAAKPEMDPLVEANALQEAQLLDVRVHAVASAVGLLFEMRTALQLRRGNAALLVVHGVRELTWATGPRASVTTAWSVVGSTPIVEGQGFALTSTSFRIHDSGWWLPTPHSM